MESLETTIPVKLLFFTFLLLVVQAVLPVQMMSQLCAQVSPEQQILKFPVWVLAEPIPGTDTKIEEKNGPYSLAIQKMKDSAPIILEGLIYGWAFTYTPSDSTRKVTEFFDFKSIEKIHMPDLLITYSQPEIRDGKLWCWIAYDRTDEMYALRHHWNSVQFPKIGGTGQGSVKNGMDGLTAAYSDAVRSGVRMYVQSIRKNKPKEISGRVLLAEYPYVSIKSGKYVVKLILILNITDIVPYDAF